MSTVSITNFNQLLPAWVKWGKEPEGLNDKGLELVEQGGDAFADYVTKHGYQSVSNWDTRGPEIAETLKKLGADLITLQEATQETNFQLMAAGLNETHAPVVQTYNDLTEPHDAQDGPAIFAKVKDATWNYLSSNQIPSGGKRSAATATFFHKDDRDLRVRVTNAHVTGFYRFNFDAEKLAPGNTEVEAYMSALKDVNGITLDIFCADLNQAEFITDLPSETVPGIPTRWNMIEEAGFSVIKGYEARTHRDLDVLASRLNDTAKFSLGVSNRDALRGLSDHTIMTSDFTLTRNPS